MLGVETMITFLTDNHEVILAVLAFAVSCMAIWQTCVSLKMQREHNAKSVLPIHSVNKLNYEDRIGIELENRGAGPLLIESIRVYKASNPHESKPNLIDWMPDMVYSTYKRTLDGVALQPGKSMYLLLFEGEQTRTFEENRDKIRKALATLEFELKYRDVYDNDFSTLESLSNYDMGNHNNDT